MDVDLGDVLDLEKQFYDIGYRDGFDHGRMHGLIEGRSLGKEKGFEMWEEVGFYMGFATIWKAVLESQTEKSPAAVSHLAHLLELTESFPTANSSMSTQGTGIDTSNEDQGVDFSQLLNRIRARYKAACASLRIRPRMRPSGPLQNPVAVESEHHMAIEENANFELDGGPQGGINKPPVWTFTSAARKAGEGGMAF